MRICSKLLSLSVPVVLFCGCLRAQTPAENRLPDPISSTAPVDPSWDMQPERPKQSTGVFGQQLVTANELRAPDKARRAVQKAAKAIQNNRVEEAANNIARALDAYPDYAAALTLRGLMDLGSRRMDAIEDLKRAIDLDPSFALPYAILASTYNDFGSYDDALPLALRAMQLLPTAWQAHFEMARTFWGRHQAAEALREIGIAMRQCSNATSSPEARAGLHFWRGRILVDQHDFAGAKQEFQSAVHEQPLGIFAQSSSQIIARLNAAAIH